MKYSDTKIIKLLEKIKEKENISYAKIEEMVEEVFKPFTVVASNPNGDCYREKRFETFEEAIDWFDLTSAPCKSIWQRGSIYPLVYKRFDKYEVGKELIQVHRQTKGES